VTLGDTQAAAIDEVLPRQDRGRQAGAVVQCQAHGGGIRVAKVLGAAETLTRQLSR